MRTKRKILAVLALGVALDLAASVAIVAVAAGGGPVSNIYVPDGVADSRPCFFFQTNGEATWYAVPVATGTSSLAAALVPMQYAMVQLSRMTGLSLSFGQGSAVSGCSNLTQAYSLNQ